MKIKEMFLVFLLLIIIALTTKYYGTVDLGDYMNTAKFFAGDYAAAIRNSHSYVFGFIHFPFIALTHNFLSFKLSSLLFLFLIVFSTYIINNRDKKTFWLMLLSPIVWYLAPWVNPVQLASLFFLWAYYFINEYNKKNKLTYLICSGIFIGLSWCIWDTVLFFALFLIFAFMYDKKLSHFVGLIFFILIGLSPRLILDFFLFGFPFFSIFKSTFGTLTNAFMGKGSSYYSGVFFPNVLIFVLIIITIPLYFWKLYNKQILSENKKSMIFLSLSVLLVLINPQIRYTIIFIPIMIVLIARYITPKQFSRQLFFSVIIILLFISPYLLQIKYSINGENPTVDIQYALEKGFIFDLQQKSNADIILQDLNEIVREYPNQTFVVGNLDDDYAFLANIYWGKDVKEFVSIQDYDLWKQNKTIIFEMTFMPIPKINERRQIWIKGGISKNPNDLTDYKNINLGLSLNEPLKEDEFSLVKKYNILYLSKKNSRIS